MPGSDAMTFRRVVLRAAAEMLVWLAVLAGGALVVWLGYLLGGGGR
jgi:hypothetical protein